MDELQGRQVSRAMETLTNAFRFLPNTHTTHTHTLNTESGYLTVIIYS